MTPTRLEELVGDWIFRSTSEALAPVYQVRIFADGTFMATATGPDLPGVVPLQGQWGYDLRFARLQLVGVSQVVTPMSYLTGVAAVNQFQFVLQCTGHHPQGFFWHDLQSGSMITATRWQGPDMAAMEGMTVAGQEVAASPADGTGFYASGIAGPSGFGAPGPAVHRADSEALAFGARPAEPFASASPRPSALPPSAEVPAAAVAVPAAPAAAPAEFTPWWTWVHLSDIHMGHGDASVHAQQELYLAELSNDILERSTHGCPAPQALLVTGDIAFSGGANARGVREYEIAREWLSDLSKRLGLAPQQVYLVPGNHDVRRVGAQHADIYPLVEQLRRPDGRLDEAFLDEPRRVALSSRLRDYFDLARYFAPCMFDANSFYGLFWTQRVALQGGQGVRLVGFNTSLLANDDTDLGRLRLGTRQLAWGFKQAVGSKDVVVALSHHPLDWLADEADIRMTIRRHVRIHLSGHVHDASTEQLRAGGGRHFVHIVAGAVHEVPTGGDVRQQPFLGYSIGALGQDASGRMRVRIWPRVMTLPGEFRSDFRNLPDGQFHVDHDLS